MHCIPLVLKFQGDAIFRHTKPVRPWLRCVYRSGLITFTPFHVPCHMKSALRRTYTALPQMASHNVFVNFHKTHYLALTLTLTLALTSIPSPNHYTTSNFERPSHFSVCVPLSTVIRAIYTTHAQ